MAAIAGVLLFVALAELTSVPDAISGALAFGVIVGLRLLGMHRDWRVPTLDGA